MINSRFFNRSELLGFLSLALLLFVILPLFLDVFRSQPRRKILNLRLRRDRSRIVLGLWRHS